MGLLQTDRWVVRYIIDSLILGTVGCRRHWGFLTLDPPHPTRRTLVTGKSETYGGSPVSDEVSGPLEVDQRV